MITKKIISISIVIVFATGGAFYVGYWGGVNNPREINVSGITNIADEKPPIDFGIFWEVWDKLKNQHIYGEKTENQKMVYGAISGVVDSLDDPNTVFFPPSDSKKFVEDISGEFGGIGAEIDIRNEQLVVVAPLKNTPAERAGLKGGDKILAINGTPTAGLADVNEAVKKIRGPVGEEVVLTILRNGWTKPRETPIVREIIQIPTLELDMKEDKIAHIKLYSFNEKAVYAFHNAIIEAALNGADGIILDLRNNPGGFLEVAVNLAGWFVDKGSVVTTEEFRSGEKRDFRANGNAALKNAPTVILVNKGSASASEILAGALRDHLGIKLIGETTFGKGTVQELQDLRDGSSLKITVAHWLLPKGTVIEKNGLTPDIEVKLKEEDVKDGKDPQLDKAIEVLKEEIAKLKAK